MENEDMQASVQSEAQSYVVVDVPSKTILMGPFMLDPETAEDWTPPIPGTVMLTAQADQEGYTWPLPPPDPAAELRDKLLAALTTNAGFLANPTEAGVLDQAIYLTRQVNAMIRLTLGQFDTTQDT